MANTYQYSPFPDTNSIRLIYLKPWRLHRNEKLRCELKTVSLDDDDVPEFEAISYAWGEPIFSCEILIDDGSKLAITPSLGDALQRMRWNTARSFKNALQRMRPGISRSRQLSSSVRILWADAVCINQQDIDERSQQVQLMRKIYRGASRVLVWLGPGGPEVPVAMKLIKKISALREEELLELAQTDYTKMEQVSPEQNAKWGLPAFDSADWSCLSRLFSRSYFTRAWIIQEVRLAREALAFCGEYEMVWDNMVQITFWLLCKSYHLVLSKGSVDAMSMPSSVGIANDTSNPIIHLLSNIRSKTATDPKDKVFSILGLAAEAIESKDTRLLPDYSKSTVQVYRDISHYVIETNTNLDMLSEAGTGHSLTDETTNFPSWVPHFDLSIWGSISQSGLHKTSNNLPLSLLPSLDEDALILRGIRFDSMLSDGRHSLQKIENLIEDSEMFETMWNNIAHQAIAYSEGKDRLWALYMTLTAGQTITYQSADNNESHLADVWAYEKELFEGAKVSGRKPLNRIELWGKEIHAANPTGSATRFKRTVTNSHRTQVLFTTAKGYIGQAPPLMLAGDIICILFGGQVPYVLRPIGSHWQLVGECYVHGIMQGEALKDFNGDMSQTEIFEIR